MDGKIKIIALVIVAIVVIAGLAVAISKVGGGGNNTGNISYGSDCHLWVYGNVNGDDYINEEDVELLQNIIDGDDYEVYIDVYDGYNAYNTTARVSLADANQDGTLNSADIQYINSIIEYQEKYSAAVSAGTLSSFTDKLTLYYNNCDNEVAAVHLPVNSLISVYFSNSEVVRLLGAVDRVVATDSTTLNKPTLLPEFQGIPTVDDRFSPSTEVILSYNADAYFTGSASTYADYLEEQIGTVMDIIRLPAWEDNNIMAGTLTLGYILGCTEKAYDYIDWCNKYLDIISDGLSSLQGKVTCICPKGRNQSLEGNGLGSGQYEITELAGAINLASSLPATSEYPDFTSEWALTQNIQFIILSGYCGFENESDVQSKVTDVIDEAYKTYAGTYAANNKQIYFITNEIFTGPSSIIAMVYCATWFYPELFSDLDGLDVFQEYIDLFCPSLANYNLSAHISQFVYGPSS